MTVDEPGVSVKRLLPFYVVLFTLGAAGIAASIAIGESTDPAPAIGGIYEVDSTGCLDGEVTIEQSGQFVLLTNGADGASSQLRLEDDRLQGDVTCADGSTQQMDLEASDESLEGTIGSEQLEARFVEAGEAAGQPGVTPDSIDGEYKTTPNSECLGSGFEVAGSDGEFELEREGSTVGEIGYENGLLHGSVTCRDGEEAELSGESIDRRITIELDRAGGSGETFEAQKTREFGRTLAAFFVAVVIVMLVSRLFGAGAARVGQPRVMGEVVAGIALGPTIFAAVAPALQATLFPSDIIPYIGVVANLGLIFYIFLVGLELDMTQLRGRVTQAITISNASVVLPMTLGMAAAVPTFALVGPDVSFVGFALFMGVAMSITAFPVLARILVERRMLKRPLGAIVMASAAIDDVTAWFLIALASAVSVAGSGLEVVRTIALAIAFCGAMFLLVRPVLARASGAYEEAGHIQGSWIVAIFAGILISAFTTEIIGIALIFGAFVMGLVMPRHAGLTEDVTGRIEDFVVTLLLPLFFAYTGLRTNIGLLDRPELWLMTLGLIAVAIAGKLAGAMVAARFVGFDTRSSAVIGTLMNTRGLTELIVLNLALEKGIISEALFASLVIMALVTTFMAGPLLRLIDPTNRYGAPVAEEFEHAGAESRAAFPALVVPDRSIVVAPLTKSGLRQLLSIAEPLARSEPQRELILAQIVAPTRGAEASVRAGLQTQTKLVSDARRELHRVRDDLVASGAAARAVTFESSSAGSDLSGALEGVSADLVLVDGRRPMLGEGVPGGEVGALLADAPCDVAVLVAREGDSVLPTAERPITVPFGGADHDWAALELGSWLAARLACPLRIIGASRSDEDAKGVQRRLDDVALLIRRHSGIEAERQTLSADRASLEDAASKSGILIVGLSQRWRQEGLGETRSALARVSGTPTLFIRRGSRPGALAPSDDYTRFGWSHVS